MTLRPLRPRLPLHVPRRIGAAALQRDDVIRDIARPAVRIAGLVMNSCRASGLRAIRPWLSPARAWSRAPGRVRQCRSYRSLPLSSRAKLPRVIEHRKRMLAHPAVQKSRGRRRDPNLLGETVDALCRAAEQLGLLVGRVAGGQAFE